MLPRSMPRACRSSSSSRTSARLGADSCGRTRWSDAIVCGPTMPSTSSPTLRWNSRDGAVGVRTEEAVLLAGVEAKRVQLALQRADVVAAEHRGVQVERAVAQPLAGLDELAPRVGPDEPVDPEVRRPGRRAPRGRWTRRSARRARRGRGPRRAPGGAVGCRGPRRPRRRGGRFARVESAPRRARSGNRAGPSQARRSAEVWLEVAHDRVLGAGADHAGDLLRRP